MSENTSEQSDECKSNVHADVCTNIHLHSHMCIYLLLTCSLILFQVTETRTGPLGCSSYDNLDSVSSILLQSPESKLHLQGKHSQLINIFHMLHRDVGHQRAAGSNSMSESKRSSIVIHSMLLGVQVKQFVLSQKLNVNACFNWGWDRFALLIPSGDCDMILFGYRCQPSNV